MSLDYNIAGRIEPSSELTDHEYRVFTGALHHLGLDRSAISMDNKGTFEIDTNEASSTYRSLLTNERKQISFAVAIKELVELIDFVRVTFNGEFTVMSEEGASTLQRVSIDDSVVYVQDAIIRWDTASLV